MPIISAFNVCSPLTAFIIYDSLHVHNILACLMQAGSTICSFLMKFLRFWIFHDVYGAVLLEWAIQSVPVPKCPTWLQKLTQQFVIKNLISWICERYFMSFRLD